MEVMDRFMFVLVMAAGILELCAAYVPDEFVDGIGIDHVHRRSSWSSHGVTMGWYKQRLDHFNQADVRTWYQRLFLTGRHHKKNGPLFVMIGAEQKASYSWLIRGNMVENAKSYNAYCLMIEHRFYGYSHPTKDLSTSNLKYLSIEQALMDVALVVDHYKKKVNASKVIVFGGSYAGILASFFRQKFPHLADAAVSSSAAVLAKVDFKEYQEVVAQVLNKYDTSGSCMGNISLAMASITNLLGSPAGRRQLRRDLRLCSNIDIKNKKDVSNLYNNLADFVLNYVQYNTLPYDIPRICSTMTNASIGTPLQRYNSITMRRNKFTSCHNVKYQHHVEVLKNVTWNARSNQRQWMYQMCTEFGFFKTSESQKPLFGGHNNLKNHIQLCTDVFGPEFNSRSVYVGVNHTLATYGGLTPNVTRVIYTQGSSDPWHVLGISKSINTDTWGILIPGTSHCEDMLRARKDDPLVLILARGAIRRFIGLRLKE